MLITTTALRTVLHAVPDFTLTVLASRSIVPSVQRPKGKARWRALGVLRVKEYPATRAESVLPECTQRRAIRPIVGNVRVGNTKIKRAIPNARTVRAACLARPTMVVRQI